MEQLEHPAISRCLSTGYPYPLRERGGEEENEDDTAYRLPPEKS